MIKTCPHCQTFNRTERRECRKCFLRLDGTPAPIRRCTTHHFACDCREARFKELLEDTLRAHSTPDNGAYNECDKDPCAWCEEAKALLYHGHPDGKFTQTTS